MFKDQMTSQERMAALFKGEKLDRVPVIPFMFGHIAVINGISIAELFENAEAGFNAQTRAREMYGYDGGNTYGYAMYGGWEFGGDVKFPRKEGEAPTVTRYPVQSEEDAVKLEVPNDILKAGSIPIALEFARLQEKHGMPITFPGSSPFVMAGNIIGVERMLIWMIESPELVRRVIKKCVEFNLKVAEHWVKEFGPERLSVFVGTATESNKLISPKHFEEFVLPDLKEQVGKMVEMGVPSFFTHICSEQTKNLPFWAQVPYPKRSIFSFGPEVSMKTAAEMLPGQIIAGNFDPVVIMKGTPEQSLEVCRKSIEEGKDLPGGYVLMSGCDVPSYSPPINVFQMMKAAREFGRY
ncbi:MAG: uroporphyrinogen decarboxylase family protein [Dehalobacterium sp.]|jgi:uroporphyrinogen decarboxylase